MNKPSRTKSLLGSFAALGALAGVIQDLFIPLFKLGLVCGLILIGLSLILSFGPQKSKLGVWLRDRYEHWKWGTVTAVLLLGIFVLGAGQISKTFGLDMVVAAESEDIKAQLQNGKDVSDFERRSGGILAKYITDLTDFQKAIANIDGQQLKTLEELKQIKASIALMHEDVKAIKRTTEDTNIVVKDTNVVVKDTNSVAKATKKDTEELLARTVKSAGELLYAKGFQHDTTSFLRALKILNGPQLKEVLTLFKSVGYNPLEKHSTWQAVANVGLSLIHISEPTRPY